jgi:glycosyltransferase involved in cell wall biosynthesis
MRVMQVIDSLRLGGSESLAATLAESFGKHGIGSLVCGLGEDGPLRDRLNALDIPCLNLNKAWGINPGITARLGFLILRQGCSAVISHHFRQLAHVAPAAKLLGRRLVHVEHDYHSYENRPDLLKKLHHLSPFISNFVGVSQEIKDWFSSQVPRLSSKVITITNGVDTDRFSLNPLARTRLREEFGIGRDCFVVGTCARLEPIKDLALLIRGFAIMVNQRGWEQDARLVLVGGGSLRDELMYTAAQEGVTDKLLITGFVGNVPDWMSVFDVYAITSLDEGLPLSVMEAMSCGLPVVSVNVGSLATIIDTEVGFIMSGRTRDELAGKLIEICRSQGMREEMGTAARQRIVNNYSLDSMLVSYIRALGKNDIMEAAA